MQSWQGASGQPGADGQQGNNAADASWHQDFGYQAPGDVQYDPTNDWTQALGGQLAYQQQVDPRDASSANFFDAHSQHPNGSYLNEAVHPAQSSFQTNTGDLGPQPPYQQTAQDVIDPAFSNLNPAFYTQQEGIFNNNNTSQPLYAQTQGLQQPQALRQHQNPAEQSFEHVHPGYSQPQGLQQQQQRQQQQQHQAARSAHIQTSSQSTFSAHPQANGHVAQYAAPNQVNYQQQQPVPQAYAQASHGSGAPRQYQQPTTSATFALNPQQDNRPVDVPTSRPVSQVQSPQLARTDSPAGPIALVEGSARKRARTAANAPDAIGSDVISFQVDSHIDNSTAKLAEIDSLPPPAPNAEETSLLTKFNKRTKAAKAKFPSIVGLPYLIHQGTVKLPTPKSYDKLAPLVALPPRSNKRVVQDLEYELPCQIQGHFSSRYQPSPDKAGLDDRNAEAQSLLTEFEKSMKSLGKRRPKYTEYPHAFKEQLKADEANKLRGKKAKKEGDVALPKPIREPIRPTDPIDGIVWDTIGIVHIEPSVSRSSSEIASRVQQTGELIIKLRGELNRAKQAVDQAAIDKIPESETTDLTKTYDLKKKALYKALDAIIEHADDAVLDNLGGHQKLILSLVNVLIACIKTGDFSGKLPKVALELFTQVPMTRKIAETSNFETVRKRFGEKGDEEVKDLVKDIASRIRKLKPTEAEYTGTAGANRKVTKPAEPTSAKRTRDDDGADGRSVKKVVVEAGGGSLSKKLAPSKPAAPVTKVTLTKPTASSSLPGKPRTAISKPVARQVDAQKPESISTSSDDKMKVDVKKTSVKADTKLPPARAPATSSSAISGIGSLLASISTPKPEVPAIVPKEVKKSEALETPEEKAKRLRKEARRKLRVTWKPESELVMVKVFEKEDSEDEGRAQNMIKDAADDRSEGMMLKQRHDIQEDDEDDDIPYQPWESPVVGDWSALPTDTRNKNYVTRGGNVTFNTDEQQKIKEREQRELMAIYTDVNDIPPTPKSPAPETAFIDPNAMVVDLPADGAKLQEVQARWKDEAQMGVDGALYSAMRRLNTQQSASGKLDSILGRLKDSSSSANAGTRPAHQVPAYTGPSNAPLAVGPAVEEHILAWLRSEKVKNWRNPEAPPTDLQAHQYSDPESQLAGTAIEALVRYLSKKPYPATSPPDWLLDDDERVREWWQGYNKEMAAKQRIIDEERQRAEAEANALLAATAAHSQQPTQQANGEDWSAWFAQLAQQNPQQQQDYAPYMAMLQQMQQQQQPPPPMPPAATAQQPQMGEGQLQSILAAFGAGGQQPQQPPSYGQTSGFSNPHEDAYQQYMRQTTGDQPSQQQQQQQYNDRDRDWDDRDHDRDRDWDRGEGSRGKKRTLPPHKPANKALIGTKPCTFWQQGKCARGDKCTFRHD